MSRFHLRKEGAAYTTVVALLFVAVGCYSPNQEGSSQQFTHSSPIRGVTWSSDSTMIAAGTLAGSVLVWDVADGHTVATIPGYAPGNSEFDDRLHNLNNVAWSPDGDFLATSSSDKSQAIRVWNTRNWQLNFAAPIAPDAQFTATIVTDLAWSSDGKRLAASIPTTETCCDDEQPEPGLIQVFNMLDGDVMSLAYPTRTLSVAWAPGDKQLAYSSIGYLLIDPVEDNVLVWDLPESKEQGITFSTNTLVRHQDSPLTLRWSPDGRFLAGGFYGGGVAIWDAATGQVFSRFAERDDRTINAVAWSPDSKRLVFTSDDTTARVWDIDGNQIVATYQHPKWATSVAWSPDGKFIATGSEDGKVRLWEVK